jgi:hypothetical protein
MLNNGGWVGGLTPIPPKKNDPTIMKLAIVQTWPFFYKKCPLDLEKLDKGPI